MPECKTDFDCGSQEKCHQGTCILACKLVSCGRNAQCLSEFHSAKCVCLSGYQGDPYSACKKGTTVFSSNFSCKYFTNGVIAHFVRFFFEIWR